MLTSWGLKPIKSMVGNIDFENYTYENAGNTYGYALKSTK